MIMKLSIHQQSLVNPHTDEALTLSMKMKWIFSIKLLPERFFKRRYMKRGMMVEFGRHHHSPHYNHTVEQIIHVNWKKLFSML